jgi:hypothetical protein
MPSRRPVSSHGGTNPVTAAPVSTEGAPSTALLKALGLTALTDDVNSAARQSRVQCSAALVLDVTDRGGTGPCKRL